jgi:hypothetical protein
LCLARFLVLSDRPDYIHPLSDLLSVQLRHRYLPFLILPDSRVQSSLHLGHFLIQLKPYECLS